MKFALSDINPKFLAANAEALRKQGVDVSGLPLKLPIAAQKVRQGGKPNLTQAMMKMAQEKGLTGKSIHTIVIDEVAEWPGEKVEPRYRSRWEREWHEILKTRGYSYCEFEPMSLNLAKASRYTPDFITIEHLKDEHGRQTRIQTAWEVKGFWREAAKVRIKVAARLFPWLRFVAVKKRKKKKGGGWEEQIFTP